MPPQSSDKFSYFDLAVSLISFAAATYGSFIMRPPPLMPLDPTITEVSELA